MKIILIVLTSITMCHCLNREADSTLNLQLSFAPKVYWQNPVSLEIYWSDSESIFCDYYSDSNEWFIYIDIPGLKKEWICFVDSDNWNGRYHQKTMRRITEIYIREKRLK